MADAVSEIIMMFPYLFRHFFHSGDRVHFFFASTLHCSVVRLFIGIVLSFHYIRTRKKRAQFALYICVRVSYNLLIYFRCVLYWNRKRRKIVAHIWVWAFKSIIINVFVFAHIHFISNIFFLYQHFLRRQFAIWRIQNGNWLQSSLSYHRQLPRTDTKFLPLILFMHSQSKKPSMNLIYNESQFTVANISSMSFSRSRSFLLSLQK